MNLIPYRKQTKLNQEIPVALSPLFLTFIWLQQQPSADYTAGLVYKELSHVQEIVLCPKGGLHAL